MASIRGSDERARLVQKEADKLAREAWNKRMLGYRGPALPSPTLGDALNASYSNHILIRCSSRRSTIRRATDCNNSAWGMLPK
jgi:hypothetical protein